MPISRAFVRLYGLFTPFRPHTRILGWQVARPGVLELAALVALALHAGRRMDGIRPDAEAASGASATATAATQQDGQRILRESLAASPLGPRPLGIFL